MATGRRAWQRPAAEVGALSNPLLAILHVLLLLPSKVVLVLGLTAAGVISGEGGDRAGTLIPPPEIRRESVGRNWPRPRPRVPRAGQTAADLRWLPQRCRFLTVGEEGPRRYQVGRERRTSPAPPLARWQHGCPDRDPRVYFV